MCVCCSARAVAVVEGPSDGAGGEVVVIMRRGVIDGVATYHIITTLGGEGDWLAAKSRPLLQSRPQQSPSPSCPAVDGNCWPPLSTVSASLVVAPVARYYTPIGSRLPHDNPLRLSLVTGRSRTQLLLLFFSLGSACAKCCPLPLVVLVLECNVSSLTN